MKKILFVLSLAIVGILGANNVYANNDNDNDNTLQKNAIVEDCTAEPTAYVFDVEYKKDGVILVSVRVKNGGDGMYRIKVTPKDQITGTVVEGSLYTIVSKNNPTGYVRFHCYSGKESEAPMCRAYTFNAEIVD